MARCARSIAATALTSTTTFDSTTRAETIETDRHAVVANPHRKLTLIGYLPPIQLDAKRLLVDRLQEAWTKHAEGLNGRPKGFSLQWQR